MRELVGLKTTIQQDIPIDAERCIIRIRGKYNKIIIEGSYHIINDVSDKSIIQKHGKNRVVE